LESPLQHVTDYIETYLLPVQFTSVILTWTLPLLWLYNAITESAPQIFLHLNDCSTL